MLHWLIRKRLQNQRNYLKKRRRRLTHQSQWAVVSVLSLRTGCILISAALSCSRIWNKIRRRPQASTTSSTPSSTSTITPSSVFLLCQYCQIESHNINDTIEIADDHWSESSPPPRPPAWRYSANWGAASNNRFLHRQAPTYRQSARFNRKSQRLLN